MSKSLPQVTTSNQLISEEAQKKSPWLSEAVDYYEFDSAKDNDVSDRKRVTQSFGELVSKLLQPSGQHQKDGPGIIGVTFLSAAGGRKNANVADVTVIQLDFDNKGSDGNISNRLTTAAGLRGWLKGRGWAGVIYETFSSTPDWPKLRVALFIKPFHIRKSADDPNAAARERLYVRIYNYLGEDTRELFDKSCSNLARLFFGPAFNLNQAEQGFAEFVPGSLVDLEEIARTLPPERPMRATRSRQDDLERSKVRKIFDAVWPSIRKEFEAARYVDDHVEGAKGDPLRKVSCFCLFAEDHGTQPPDPNDKSMFAYSPDAAEHDTTTIGCLHNGCKEKNRTSGDYIFEIMRSHDHEISDLEEYLTSGGRVALHRAMEKIVLTDEEIEDCFDELETELQIEAEQKEREAASARYQKRLEKLQPKLQRVTALAAKMARKREVMANRVFELQDEFSRFDALVRQYEAKKQSVKLLSDRDQAKLLSDSATANDDRAVCEGKLKRAQNELSGVRASFDANDEERKGLEASQAEISNKLSSLPKPANDNFKEVSNVTRKIKMALASAKDDIKTRERIARLAGLLNETTINLAQEIKAERRSRLSNRAEVPLRQFEDQLPVVDLREVGGPSLTAAIYAAFEQRTTMHNRPIVFSTFDKLSIVVTSEAGARLKGLETAGLQGAADQCAHFTRSGREVHAPAETCKIILHSPVLNTQAFPPLEYIIDSPRFGPDWKLLNKPGYYPECKTLYVEGGIAIDGVPANPTQEEVEAARNILCEELFADFSFKDIEAVEVRREKSHPRRRTGDASLANALALLLTPLVQGAIRGEAIPPFLLYKPQARVGASLCATVAMIPAMGEIVSAQAVPSNAYQWQNALLALARERAKVLFLDNVKTKIDDGTFAASLTQGRVKGRELGLNASIDGPVTWVTIITGINPQLSDELTRRSVSIRFESATDRPEDRTDFKHGNDAQLRSWALAHRGELLRAGLILIQSWLAKGGESYEVSDLPQFGGFGRWNRVMAGILDAANVKGFRDNIENFEFVNVEADTDEPIYAAWSAIFGNRWVGIGKVEKGVSVTRDELVVQPQEYGLLGLIACEQLEIVGEDGRCLDTAQMSHGQQQNRLGKWLQQKNGATVSFKTAAGPAVGQIRTRKNPETRRSEARLEFKLRKAGPTGSRG